MRRRAGGLYLPALDAAGDMIEFSRSIAIVATKIIIARDKASQYSFHLIKPDTKPIKTKDQPKTPSVNGIQLPTNGG